jgi:hypothetical protein
MMQLLLPMMVELVDEGVQVVKHQHQRLVQGLQVE